MGDCDFRALSQKEVRDKRRQAVEWFHEAESMNAKRMDLEEAKQLLIDAKERRAGTKDEDDPKPKTQKRKSVNLGKTAVSTNKETPKPLPNGGAELPSRSASKGSVPEPVP